jgi:hypothetical protein
MAIGENGLVKVSAMSDALDGWAAAATSAASDGEMGAR